MELNMPTLLALLLCLYHFTYGLPNFAIQIVRPRVYDYGSGSFDNFINDAHSFTQNARVVFFQICHPELDALSPLDFQWVITFKSTNFSIRLNTTDCYLRWQAPSEGPYNVSVSLRTGIDKLILDVANKAFFVRDIWVVALGDSYASGQGNPDVAAQFMGYGAQWISEKCYRSGYGSWTFKTYKHIELQYKEYGILFSYLACSGASILKGLLEKGPEGLSAQLDVIEEIKEAANEKFCKRDCEKSIEPDLVLLGVGGNDIDFAETVYLLFMGESKDVFSELPQKFVALEEKFKMLALAMDSKLGVPREAIFYPHYYDSLKNESGLIDVSCLYFTKVAEFSQAHREMLTRLNMAISESSRIYNWTVVDDISDIFQYHGICSKRPYIRSILESVNFQGNYYGAFHPTRQGHAKVAKKVWVTVHQYLKKRWLAEN